MQNATRLTTAVRRLLADGQSLEEAIAFLRRSGRSKGESILVIADAQGIDTSAATAAVHGSATWRDRAESDTELNRSIWDGLNRAGTQRPDGAVDLTDWLNTRDE
ncbi:MAG: hypothetical protein IRY91_01710 [Gemmatimonadaceae bacterium]|nr:hypothetical protein [Gemmatimonadaceae bacterium]